MLSNQMPTTGDYEPKETIPIEIGEEEILNLKSILEDKDIMKIAYTKQYTFPYTLQSIINDYEHNLKE